MKERAEQVPLRYKLAAAALGAGLGLGLNLVAENITSQAYWPEYALNFVKELLSHPLTRVGFLVLGGLLGWLVPESFADNRRQTGLDMIVRQERGSARIALLGIAAVLAIGSGALATEVGQPALKAITDFPRGVERVVSDIGASLNYPGR